MITTKPVVLTAFRADAIVGWLRGASGDKPTKMDIASVNEIACGLHTVIPMTAAEFEALKMDAASWRKLGLTSMNYL